MATFNNEIRSPTESSESPYPLGDICGSGESFDGVIPPKLPVGWAAINAIDPDGIFWQTSASGDPTPPANSPPNAAWVDDPDAISDKYLEWSAGTIDPHTELADLSFSHNYALEDTFDGGVLEISVDGGPFQDILAAGGFFGQGGYNGTISSCCGNPLAGRQAWTGTSGGFIGTDVDLSAFVGHTISLRWRMGSDSNGFSDGWRIDDVAILCMRSTPTPTPPVTPTATATPTPTATPPPTPRPTPTPRARPVPPPRPTPP
jgi:Predicted solute binding protein